MPTAIGPIGQGIQDEAFACIHEPCDEGQDRKERTEDQEANRGSEWHGNDQRAAATHKWACQKHTPGNHERETSQQRRDPEGSVEGIVPSQANAVLGYLAGELLSTAKTPDDHRGDCAADEL